jgi:DsbC/DsbD-like thiol-disulfide interchange protein
MKLSRNGMLALGVVLAGALGSSAPALAAKPDIQAVLTAPASLAAGATGKLVVEMRLGPGWHVNSHTPKASFLIPTNVTLSASMGVVSDVRYPKHVERAFEFSNEPLAVYEGTVRFEADLTAPTPASGTIAVTGTLTYQACDEHACYPPAAIDLEATIAVAVPQPQSR